VSVKPVTPLPAATLVILRDAAPGVELLLMQRHRASKFAAGDYVFPGGKVEMDDVPDDAATWCAGLDPARAAARIGIPGEPRKALGYWIGAIRETFEEVGILLAYDAAGNPAPVNEPRFADYRALCEAEKQAFFTMLRTEGLTLACDRLVFFAHWITPEESPFRYDTHFFAAPLPEGQTPVSDEHEVIDMRWLSPAAAIAAFKRGEISLRNPTVQNLKLFDGAASVKEALERVEGREVAVIRPRVVMEGDRRRVLMPGDPGWY
jgi:8-oxo-dGTP pyrophosphatase MutT (NUDIX family)